MCDIFRKNYRECFQQHGAKQCRAELDEVFKCIYQEEVFYRPVLRSHLYSQMVSLPSINSSGVPQP